jgi:CheY-like chemotaxis protein
LHTGHCTHNNLATCRRFAYATGVDAKLGKTVLVVDDDVIILRLVRESLSALLGCEVETTPNAEYAFELMLRKHYDLLIFDFSMPVIDGAVLYSLISKVYEINPPTGLEQNTPPLILMSGNASQKRAQELLREPGGRGLLAKPFSIEKMVEKVSALLGN